jgi:hypothetical protein
MDTPGVSDLQSIEYGLRCYPGVEIKTMPTGLGTVGLGSLSVRGGTNSRTSSKTWKKNPLISDWDARMSPRDTLRKIPSG